VTMESPLSPWPEEGKRTDWNWKGLLEGSIQNQSFSFSVAKHFKTFSVACPNEHDPWLWPLIKLPSSLQLQRTDLYVTCSSFLLWATGPY
jgi:hypothetical protein